MAATKDKKPLTEEALLRMPEADYMNEAQLAFFRDRLQTMEREILHNAGETTEHLRETVIVPDPADRATIEEEHALELRTRDRERKLLKKIQQAIASIDAGDYGYCEETGEPIFAHHPFCSPHPDDFQYMDSDPLRVRAQSYDLVMNGNEILSGSIRIHDKALQEKIFTILGFSEEEKERRFGFMVNAFKYGAPPHGGCAFGFDRWVMLMAGGETIRDVIPFPKNNNGRDMMMDAPGEVENDQLKIVGIRLL